MYLLEHDRRFAVFPEFVFYDYMQPVKLPGKSLLLKPPAPFGLARVLMVAHI